MEASMRLVVLVGVILAIGLPAEASAQAGAPAALAEPRWPNQREADFVVRDFHFASGETLAELRLHYITLGTPQRNAAGAIANGVLLLHGTGGTSTSWLQASLAGELFGAGQPLDAARYFIIIPDGIGAGRSTKPSDGLRNTFPKYRYRDMVQAQYRLLTEGLGIRHLRLVIGTSMGGMHTWLWGGMYPDYMDGLVPLASQPTPMSGRNWLMRRIRIEAIRNAPDAYMYTLPLAQLNTESVVRLQEMAPTRDAADALYRKMVEDARRNNPTDQLYVLEASMDYDPSPELRRIRAPLLAVNFADDEINPPELGVVEPALAKIPTAKSVLIPAGPETHGHYTYFRAAIWKPYLVEFMKTLEARHE
jgi:homoserine O-acetyltransferase